MNAFTFGNHVDQIPPLEDRFKPHSSASTKTGQRIYAGEAPTVDAETQECVEILEKIVVKEAAKVRNRPAGSSEQKKARRQIGAIIGVQHALMDGRMTVFQVRGIMADAVGMTNQTPPSAESTKEYCDSLSNEELKALALSPLRNVPGESPAVVSAVFANVRKCAVARGLILNEAGREGSPGYTSPPTNKHQAPAPAGRTSTVSTTATTPRLPGEVSRSGNNVRTDYQQYLKDKAAGLVPSASIVNPDPKVAAANKPITDFGAEGPSAQFLLPNEKAQAAKEWDEGIRHKSWKDRNTYIICRAREIAGHIR